MSEATSPSPRQALSEFAGSIWWLILIRGVLLLILGLYALFRPGMTMDVLAKIIGIFVLIDGIAALVAGILGQTPSRGWTIARGVLGILIGIFVLGHSAVVAAVTAIVVVCLLAFTAIISGVFEVIAAFQERKQIEGEWWLILGGVLSVIFGVILLIAPFAFGVFLVRVLGVYAVICGISLIVTAFRVRKFSKAIA